ncbi:hypothetical protein [Maritimibacter dapengensis]|uniref:Uncharacterized protein n=1 Tax=Maritimibacter dapengensis TaxID=2836868 RepID=A0ABS6T336_9RHOB|nr:hypothetical protein [Maritimibacter dapengensis]MBV7379643.1 hypothetical protein [Maritimibacter dapengensis]
MQQIILVVLAIVLGLGFGALTGGFAFSSLVCVVAGVFLVTPSLFKFDTHDLKLVGHHMPTFGRNLAINYLILPLIALVIGFASRDIGIAGALFLLALLPGGGMVMMWIKTSGANPKLGFILFMLNLALLLPVTLVFSQFFDLASPYFPAPDLSQTTAATGRSVRPFAPFVILIVIPFLLSRLARASSPKLISFVERHQQIISKATMFGIVFYLFSLSTSQMLFSVELMALAKAVVATAAFYAAAVLVAGMVTKDTPEGRAVYWHVVTRYITLALILAVFSIDTFGATFILPVMVAYFIQIGAAGALRSRMLARSGAMPA